MDNKEYLAKIPHGVLLTHRVTLAYLAVTLLIGVGLGYFIRGAIKNVSGAVASKTQNVRSVSLLAADKRVAAVRKNLPTPPRHGQRNKKANSGQWPTVKVKSFSLSYPPDWAGKKEGDKAYFIVRPTLDRGSDEPKGDLTAYAIDNPKKLSLNDFFNGAKAPNYFNQARGGVLPIATDQFTGMEFVGVPQSPGTSNIWILAAGDSFIVLDDGFGINPFVTQQILNTVKLLKQ